MNYVSHTRAAHQRISQQPEAKTQHIALYWELFFQWNAGFFKGAVELDHQATMKAARIGSKHTYRDTLRDLDKWGLIAYQPSQSRYDVSRCEVLNLSGPEVAPMKRTEATSGPHENSSSGPEVAQVLRPEVAPMKASCGPLLAQDTLYVKHSLKHLDQNVGGGTKKNGEEGFADDGLSSAEVLDDTAPPDEAGPPRSDDPGDAPKKKVAPKKKGVQPEGQEQQNARKAPPRHELFPEHTTTPEEGDSSARGKFDGKKGKREATVGAAAQFQTANGTTRRKGAGRQKKPEIPFADSELATYEQFEAAFAGTDYALADLRYYHAKVVNWRQKGIIPRRRDWKATATQFFLNDAKDNSLKLAPGVQHHNGTSSSSTNPGGPDTGYRTSRWD